MFNPRPAERRPASARRPSLSVAKLLRLVFAAAFTLALGAGAARAQCVSLTTAGSAYTQNFNTLSNTANSTMLESNPNEQKAESAHALPA